MCNVVCKEACWSRVTSKINERGMRKCGVGCLMWVRCVNVFACVLTFVVFSGCYVFNVFIFCFQEK